MCVDGCWWTCVCVWMSVGGHVCVGVVCVDECWWTCGCEWVWVDMSLYLNLVI